MNEVTHLIGGKSVAQDGRFFSRIHPIEDIPATKAAAATAFDVDAAAIAAAASFPGWAATGP